MSDTNKRKIIGDYSEYLKLKSMSNISNDKNYDYLKCFNKAVELINNDKISEGVALLKELYSIKKDPAVYKLINDNRDFC